MGRIVDSNIPRNSEKWTVAPYELCVISGECLRLARLTGETNLIAEAQRSIAAVKGATSENSRRNATEEELPIIDSQNIQDGLKISLLSKLLSGTRDSRTTSFASLSVRSPRKPG